MEAKEDFRKYMCLNNEKSRRTYTHSDEVDIEPIKSILLRAIKVLATVWNKGLLARGWECFK